tara:strand:- start:733 stop:1542 length:810 start_codon:yes stop_codon:yes gene_type:complete
VTTTDEQLDRTFVVLHEPQDLVNIALVIRAMKNMGLSQLRLVRPAEYDAWRVTGIAHDTEDVVEKVEVFDDITTALASSKYVLGATARRRSTRQNWWSPEDAAQMFCDRGEPFAFVFGREDRGLPNEVLDLCHGLVCIPTNPQHSSMNLAHAALIVFYELRKAVTAAAGLETQDKSFKKRRQTPPVSHEELEDFFGKWKTAMEEVGLFHGLDPIPKMRSFRAIFQRADMDRRELGLIKASAYEIINFSEREQKRAKDRAEAELEEIQDN